MNIIKRLSGHSGCSVCLIQDRDETFIRKQSPNKEYNLRLEVQCDKQKNFNQKQRVKAPIVYKSGYIDDLFFFDMEYIRGKTLADHFNEILIPEIVDFSQILMSILKNIESDETYSVDDIAFKNKISTIVDIIPQETVFTEAINILKEFDFSNVPGSKCHGDLTLENIIITKNKDLYLIDFLDSFYNSWMIDVAKLFQDLYLGWSFRNCSADTNRDIRKFIAMQTITEQILLKEDGMQILNKLYHILLLHLLRIVPYCNDNLTYNFLITSCKNLTEEICNKFGRN